MWGQKTADWIWTGAGGGQSNYLNKSFKLSKLIKNTSRPIGGRVDEQNKNHSKTFDEWTIKLGFNGQSKKEKRKLS